MSGMESATMIALDIEVIQAIENGELRKVEAWLEVVCNESVNSIVDDRDLTYTGSGDSEVNSKGMSALHYAAFYAKVEIVKVLLKAGADPTVKNEDEENALHCAVQSEYEDSSIAEVTSLLLSNRDDYVDDITEGSRWTALLIAVHLNHSLTVQCLLDHGADPAIDVKAGKDKYRYSLAMAAVHEGPILKKLLDTEKCNVNWEDGKYTALHLAVKFFKPDNVKVLVEKKANMLARDSFGMCPIHYCIGATSNSDFERIVSCLRRSVNEQDEVFGYTLLHSAVIQGKTEYVRILRHKFNAGYSRKDKQGRLPIHYLYNQSDVQDLVDLLGDTDQTIDGKDKKGLTPLHYAVKKNDPDFVKCLLDNGADHEITATKQKHWLIHLATTASGTDNDFETMVSVLMKIPNLNISQLDANKRTPLHFALDMRRFSRAKTLLKYGADSSIADCDRKNCLHIAFQRCCPGDVIKMLLKGHEGLDEARDQAGNTPIQYLSAKTPLSAIKALDEFGRSENDGGEECVEVTLECGKVKRQLQLPVIMSAVQLLEHAKEEFDRTDVTVQQYEKDSDSWVPILDDLLTLNEDDTFKVKVIAATKEPPLNRAIELRRLDMVKLLLVKGVVLDTETLEEAIVKEDEELAHILVRHAKDIKTPLNQVIPTPSYIGSVHNHTGEEVGAAPLQPDTTTTLFRELIKHMPNVAKEALQRSVQLAGDDKFKLDFSYILQSNNEKDLRTIGEEGVCTSSCSAMPHCNKPPVGSMENPLELMVAYERIQLMQHPVVWTYLYLKWNGLGFWFYFFELFTFGVFLMCLSLFVLVVNDPQSVYCTEMNTTSESDGDCGPTERRIISYIFAVLVIVLALYHLVVEVVRLIYDIKAYFRVFKNYVELVLFISSILFVFNFVNPCGCPKDWQWHVGIFVVFLG